MASSVTVRPDATSWAPTGGTDIVYTRIGDGRYANLSAALSSPMYLDVDSTISNDSGKESSYLIKFRHYQAPPAGAPYNSPDPVLQVHSVIKCDTSVWTQTQIYAACQSLAHMLIQTGLIGPILRGDR